MFHLISLTCSTAISGPSRYLLITSAPRNLHLPGHGSNDIRDHVSAFKITIAITRFYILFPMLLRIFVFIEWKRN
jgi:hypothetical protein